MSALLERFRFAPEKTSLDAILEGFGLAPLLDHFEADGGLKSARDLVLGSTLKLSPQLSPRVFNLLDDVTQTLGYSAALDVFVRADASINAYAIQSLEDYPHMIILTSSLLERVSDEELRFVLGHEIGHIYYGHNRIDMVQAAVGEDEDGSTRMPPLLSRKLENWERLAELSADRAGFAASGGDLTSIVSAFFKIASGLGPEHLSFEIGAFLNQLSELESLEKRELICGFSHPVTPIRVRALQLLDEAGGIDIPEESMQALDQEVEELSKLMDYMPGKPLQRQSRDFLIAGGLLIGQADERGISEDEREVLIDILLPICHDPEASLAEISTVTQARAMLAESAGWLKENAGEERYSCLRYLAGIATVDGVLHPKEEAMLVEVAAMLGIPESVARREAYEMLTHCLQSRQSSPAKVSGMNLAP